MEFEPDDSRYEAFNFAVYCVGEIRNLRSSGHTVGRYSVVSRAYRTVPVGGQVELADQADKLTATTRQASVIADTSYNPSLV